MKEKIEKILTEQIPGIDLSSEAFVDEGYINSIVMIALISEFDIAFDIEIGFDSINKQNFSSVVAIENMLSGYLK